MTPIRDVDALTDVQRTALRGIYRAGDEPVIYHDWMGLGHATARLRELGLVKVVPVWNEAQRRAVPGLRLTDAGVLAAEAI